MRGGIKYQDIPYKYRSHIKEDIHSARDSFDKAVQSEKERYENSNTGRFTNFMGQVVTAPMSLPAATVVAPVVGDVVQPIVQAGSKYIAQPVSQYLSQHPVMNGVAKTGRYLFDLGGTGYGLYNLFGEEGWDKTKRKFNEGNLA